MPTIDNVASDTDIDVQWGNDVADELNLYTAKWDPNDTVATSPDGSMWLAGELPALVIARNTGQSIPNASSEAITWPDEVTNLGGFATTTGTVTIPTGMAGLYLVTLNVIWASDSTGIRQIGCNIGSNSYSVPDQFGSVSTPQTSVGNWQLAAMQVPLSAGATVQAVAYQNSGGPLSIEEGSLAVTMLRHLA